MASDSAKHDSPGYGCLAAFGAIWCAMIGLFDFLIARDLAGKLYATTFDTTQGVIIQRATLEMERAGEESGPVRYRYDVGGRAYIGHRFRFRDDDEPSREDRALAAVRALPEGSACTVHFNPRKPEQSVLRTGWEGSDLFTLMFITPFNALALGFVCWWLTPVYRRLRPTELPGMPILRDGLRTTVRLPRFAPGVVAVMALAGGTFFMSFIVGFAASGSYLTMGAALAAWGVVGALALGEFAWRRRRMQSGADDLVLDRATGELSLPLTLGRKERVLISWGQVRGVEVLEEVTENSDGKSSHYYPCLVWDSGSEMQRVKVVWCWSRERAERLTHWLQKEMSLPAAPHQHGADNTEPALRNQSH